MKPRFKRKKRPDKGLYGSDITAVFTNTVNRLNQELDNSPEENEGDREFAKSMIKDLSQAFYINLLIALAQKNDMDAEKLRESDEGLLV